MCTVGAKAGTIELAVRTADSPNRWGGDVAGQRRSKTDLGKLSALLTVQIAGAPGYCEPSEAFSTVADERRLSRTHRTSRWETPAAQPSVVNA